MTAFHVGQQIRLTGSGWQFPLHGLAQGTVVTVLEVIPDGRALVDASPGYRWYADPDAGSEWGAEPATPPASETPEVTE